MRWALPSRRFPVEVLMRNSFGLSIKTWPLPPRRFIRVLPGDPGKVGADARVIKTLGYTAAVSLYLSEIYTTSTRNAGLPVSIKASDEDVGLHCCGVSVSLGDLYHFHSRAPRLSRDAPIWFWSLRCPTDALTNRLSEAQSLMLAFAVEFGRSTAFPSAAIRCTFSCRGSPTRAQGGNQKKIAMRQVSLKDSISDLPSINEISCSI